MNFSLTQIWKYKAQLHTEIQLKSFFKKKKWKIPLIIIMSKAKNLLAIIMSLALLSTLGHACTGYNSLDLLKTDTVIFQNTPGVGPQTCYTTTIQFEVPVRGFQTALSVSNFYNVRPSQEGYDFSVRGGQKDRSKTLSISLLVDDHMKWSKIAVSYLATARNDMYVGTFLADAFAQYDCNKQGSLDLEFKTNVSDVATGYQYDAKVFLSGIKVKDPEFQLTFKSTIFNERTGVLQVKINSDANPHIENIHFSYIIYRRKFDFSINIIPSGFVKSEDYVFNHVASFSRRDGAQIMALTIDTDRCECVGRRCDDKCYTVSRCKAAGGVYIGRTCYICGKYEKYDNKGCIPICRDNEEYNTRLDTCDCKAGYSRDPRSDQCRWNCGLNEIWDGKCVCKDGCARYGGSCIVCPPNSRRKGDQCVCDRDYYWNTRKYTCQYLSCPANSAPALINDKMQCKCDKDYYWNDRTKKCEYLAPCPSNSKPELIKDTWRCVCDTDYYWNDDRKTCDYLAPCPANSKPGFVGKDLKCICDSNYYWNKRKGICDFVSPCGPYATVTLVGDEWKCTCNSDCYESGKDCKPYPICPPNSKFNPRTQECQCLNSNHYNIDGSCKPCGKYEQYNRIDRKFRCISGYRHLNGRCVRICSEYEDQNEDDCVCKSSCYYSSDRKCSPCPANMRPNADRTACVCIDGFYADRDNKCVQYKRCPEGMERNSANNCVCKDGHYLDGGSCKATPKCPSRSKWNQDKFRCDCTINGQYMINNVCTACKDNEGWNGKQCACSTGYFKIDGTCKQCDPNSYYVRGECECNLGFYGKGRDKCFRCHGSCGKCQGPRQDQCLSCSDVSFTFTQKGGKAGTCSRSDNCPVGLYSQQGTQGGCKPCSSYCATCVSQTICKTCISGFQMNEMEYQGTKYSYCVEICGDGRRFELDCDDGNKKNGDGCNENCQVQAGWHCQGATTQKPSVCVNFKPNRSYITLTGSVHAFGKIVQGVRLSYIPPELTANDCMNCHKLLWVRVVSSSVVPGVRVNYLPKSQYQFLTQFDFNGLFAIPVFTISVQINPDFAQYFTESDLAQIQVKSIDPATLAKADKTETLSIDDLEEDKDKDTEKTEIEKGIAEGSRSILFPDEKPKK